MNRMMNWLKVGVIVALVVSLTIPAVEKSHAFDPGTWVVIGAVCFIVAAVAAAKCSSDQMHEEAAKQKEHEQTRTQTDDILRENDEAWKTYNECVEDARNSGIQGQENLRRVCTPPPTYCGQREDGSLQICS